MPTPHPVSTKTANKPTTIDFMPGTLCNVSAVFFMTVNSLIGAILVRAAFVIAMGDLFELRLRVDDL